MKTWHLSTSLTSRHPDQLTSERVTNRQCAAGSDWERRVIRLVCPVCCVRGAVWREDIFGDVVCPRNATSIVHQVQRPPAAPPPEPPQQVSLRCPVQGTSAHTTTTTTTTTPRTPS
ncbi:hypothetical protein O3P69_016719 [Scylla paramamosain]|uniref:Uncharacterized protein n=1 Tax=Scylla paramamosain TaxID=85552 RepID=A0AAW0SXZ4_SCYPA